ncbi:MAG: methyl-accepting chemotaxis protein, partial [Paracraurococcus sp.]
MDLARIRRGTGWLMIGLLWAAVAAAGLLGLLSNGPGLPGFGLAGLAALAASLACRHGFEAQAARFALAAAAVVAVSVLVAMVPAWLRIDLHMAYFACLALLAGFCDRRTIAVATAATALHHLLLNFALPMLVFPDGGNLARVALHAAILLAEAAALFWITGALEQAA